MTNMVSLAKEDMSLVSDAIKEVAKSILKGIGKSKLQLTNILVEHINTLTESINEV